MGITLFLAFHKRPGHLPSGTCHSRRLEDVKQRIENSNVNITSKEEWGYVKKPVKFTITVKLREEGETMKRRTTMAAQRHRFLD